ncbi:MAG: multiheme c-type cytochrome [Candidatus Riflebacteria bacterium]|nr:multiheme c-type cytochrome [Candidatus Riflebacteria bacterium]
MRKNDGNLCGVLSCYQVLAFVTTLLAFAGYLNAQPAPQEAVEPAYANVVPVNYTSSVVTSDETARCLNCHASRQIKLVETWEHSTHARNGVGCYECHKADPGDPAAKNGHFSFSVQLPVSPLTCASCHPAQYASFASSSHAMAFETIKDLPIRTESPILFETTCAVCHGNELQMKRGRALNNTWPNHGIGRVNTDGSRGNCSACHGHHDDSLKQARSPETCGKCHRGDTGPAYEAWQASRHGNNWQITSAGIDLDKKNLVPVNERLMRPDCFVCHLAPASETATATHNPSERLSWKLAAMQSLHTENWGQKRMQMQASCRNCHASTQVDMYFRRLDASVLEFNRLASEAAVMVSSGSKALDLIKGAAIKGRIGAAMLSPLHGREAVDQLSR